MRDSINNIFYDRDTANALFNGVGMAHIAYSDSVILLDDGYAGTVFRCAPLIGCDSSTVEMLKSALSIEIPDDSFVQFSQFASPYVERLLDLHTRARGDIINRKDGQSEIQKELLSRMAERRREFIREGTYRSLYQAKDILLKDSQLIVSLKVPIHKAVTSITSTDLQPLLAASTALKSSLETVQLNPRQMSAADYLYLMRCIMNIGKREPERWYDETVRFSDQIVDFETEIEFKPNITKINNRVVRSLSVARFPTQTHLGLMNYLIGDPKGGQNQIRDPYLFNTTVYFPSYVNKKAEIGRQFAWMTKMAQGPLASFSPKIHSKHRGFSLLSSSMENKNRPVMVWSNLVLFSESEERSARTSGQVKTYYQSLGFDLKDDTMYQWPAVMNALPLGPEIGSTSPSHRWNTCTIEHAANILPVIGEWVGTGVGGNNIFIGRRGQVMLWDPFDSDGSKNVVIAAASGSGKSFVTNYIVTGVMQKGGRIRIIDQGRSYEKLSESIDGQFIAFNDGSDICLNPFTHVRNIDDEMEMIRTSIEAMAAPKQPLNDFLTSALDVVIRKVWEDHKNDANITLIAAQCAESTDPRVKDLAVQLESWTRHGSYGKWFDGRNNLNYSNAFVVLELDDLKVKKTLQTVVLMQVINRITQEVYITNTEGKPYVLVIDEAWEQLQDPKVVKFLEGASRRFRKYNASLFIITQSLNDMYGSPSGIAITENTYHFVVLRQTSESIDGLKRSGRFNIGEYGFSMLQTVHTKKGEYSELYFKSSERGTGLGQLVVDRFTQLMYSTDAVERSRIDILRKRGFSVADSIDEYIRLEREGTISSVG